MRISVFSLKSSNINHVYIGPELRQSIFSTFLPTFFLDQRVFVSQPRTLVIDTWEAFDDDMTFNLGGEEFLKYYRQHSTLQYRHVPRVFKV